MMERGTGRSENWRIVRRRCSCASKASARCCMTSGGSYSQVVNGTNRGSIMLRLPPVDATAQPPHHARHSTAECQRAAWDLARIAAMNAGMAASRLAAMSLTCGFSPSFFSSAWAAGRSPSRSRSKSRLATLAARSAL